MKQSLVRRNKWQGDKPLIYWLLQGSCMSEPDPELGKEQWHWKKKEGGRYKNCHFLNSVKLGNFTGIFF